MFRLPSSKQADSCTGRHCRPTTNVKYVAPGAKLLAKLEQRPAKFIFLFFLFFFFSFFSRRLNAVTFEPGYLENPAKLFNLRLNDRPKDDRRFSRRLIDRSRHNNLDSFTTKIWKIFRDRVLSFLFSFFVQELAIIL